MTDSQKELDELKNLQEQSQKLREQRDVAQKDTGVVPQVSTEAVSDTDHGQETAPVQSEGDEAAEGLGDQVADIMSELEEAAAEHPTLALLAAFGIGVFVGQLLSRK